MKTRIEEKIIKQEQVVYIAHDGKEFITEKECLKYEKELAELKDVEQAEKLKIPELDDKLPLDREGLVNDNNSFLWYKVNNKEEFDVLNSAYANSLSEPEIYPEIICVETCGYEPYKDDAYDYHLTSILKNTKEFWKDLGYKIEITKQ